MNSDMTVFATLLYYFGISARLFYSFNGQLTEKGMETTLMVADWDSYSCTMKDVKIYQETLCRYLNYQNQREVLGVGCGAVQMTKPTQFPQEVYIT